jgi:hypothetical protein
MVMTSFSDITAATYFNHLVSSAQLSRAVETQSCLTTLNCAWEHNCGFTNYYCDCFCSSVPLPKLCDLEPGKLGINRFVNFANTTYDFFQVF